MAVGYQEEQDSIANRLVKSFLRKHGCYGAIALQVCFDVDPLQLDIGGTKKSAHPEVYVHLADRITNWMRGVGNALFSGTETSLAQSLSLELTSSFRRMRILEMDDTYEEICKDLVMLIKRELGDIGFTKTQEVS